MILHLAHNNRWYYTLHTPARNNRWYYTLHITTDDITPCTHLHITTDDITPCTYLHITTDDITPCTYLHITTDDIIALYILIYTILDSRQWERLQQSILRIQSAPNCLVKKRCNCYLRFIRWNTQRVCKRKACCCVSVGTKRMSATFLGYGEVWMGMQS